MSDKLDDYVQTGLYGAKETKRAERKQYLGTIRERVLFALTKGQVMRQEGMDQLEKDLQNKNATELLLNGEVSFRFLTDYKKLADRYNVEYTTVSNLEVETDLGIVLTADQAVDKEDIFLSTDSDKEEKKQQADKRSESLLSRIKSIFRSNPDK